MLNSNTTKTISIKDHLFQIIVVCGLGLIIGALCGMFSGLLVFIILAALFFMYASIKRPELGLLGILVATSSIVFEDQLPLIPVGGLSLHLPDILLLGMLGLIIMRWLVEPKFKLMRTPLDWPLIIFIGVTLFSTIIALFQSSVDPVDARRWSRVLTYYLTFFIVTNLVRDDDQINKLVNGFFILATIIATSMVVQYFLGSSISILPGRIETLNTQGTLFEGITRIVPPGFSIVLVSFVTLLCLLILEKSKPLGWLKIFQCGILGMAILVTFLRSYLVVLIVMVIFLGYLLKGVDRQKLIGLVLLVTTIATIILALIYSYPGSRATKFVGALTDRMSTIVDIGTFQGEDGSLNWRMIENGYALSSITENPIIGSGMGFTYRPFDRRIDTTGDTYDFRKHIHNSYFWILLQSGLLGFLPFIWLSLAFLLRGLKYWRSISNVHFKGIVLGFSLVYMVLLMAAITNSTFMQWAWTPVIGVIMGINEVILFKSQQEMKKQVD